MKITLLLLLLSIFSQLGAVNALFFAGSTRTDSVNKKLIKEAAQIAREKGANVKVIDLRDYPMPLYDADLETAEGMPTCTRALRQLMIESDIIFIASPEYNKSVTGVLKNALDWVSRGENGDYSDDAYKGKLFVLLSASPARAGGSEGLSHLRVILASVHGSVFPNQFSLSHAYQAFNDKGQLKDPKLHADLAKLVTEALDRFQLARPILKK